LRRSGYELDFDGWIPRRPEPRAGSTALDIVLSDHAMPEFSALAALAILKQRGLDLPFIIVSGNMSEEVAVTAMKAGAHDFFVKRNLPASSPPSSGSYPKQRGAGPKGAPRNNSTFARPSWSAKAKPPPTHFCRLHGEKMALE